MMFRRSGRIGQAGHGTKNLAKSASGYGHVRIENNNIHSDNPEYRHRKKGRGKSPQLLLNAECAY